MAGVVAGGMETPFVMDRFPDTDVAVLRGPEIVADTVVYALSVPSRSALAESSYRTGRRPGPEVSTVPCRRRQPSTPVAVWAEPTGLDSGEPRCLR